MVNVYIDFYTVSPNMAETSEFNDLKETYLHPLNLSSTHFFDDTMAGKLESLVSQTGKGQKYALQVQARHEEIWQRYGNPISNS